MNYILIALNVCLLLTLITFVFKTKVVDNEKNQAKVIKKILEILFSVTIGATFVVITYLFADWFNLIDEDNVFWWQAGLAYFTLTVLSDCFKSAFIWGRDKNNK